MTPSFRDQASELRHLTIAHPAASGLGGYGPNGEVIYTKQPTGCPSVLVDSRGGAKATVMSNGSVEFRVRGDDGFEVEVLRGHFDPVEKREIGVPSQDLWLRLEGAAGAPPSIASLVNPQRNLNLEPAALKLVKLNQPNPTFWFTAEFAPTSATRLEAAAAFLLVTTDSGPALLRRCWLHNAGRQNVAGQIWSFFNLMGTQRFVYNKSAWYDRGLPLSPDEVVVAATVPVPSSLQVKRLSARASANLTAGEATCDAFRFVGDSAATSLFPAAVRQGKLISWPGDPAAFNRFSSPTIAAVSRTFRLAPGEDAVLEEALLYVTAPDALQRFAEEMRCDEASYRAVAAAFQTAARNLLSRTADVGACIGRISAEREGRARHSVRAEGWQAGGRRARSDAPYLDSPEFQIAIPAEPAAACYLNSLWAGMAELYENCRAHGARLADGIELGTRDRAQDMWPMMKVNPARVRADLLHALSFLYRTVNAPIPAGVRPLTRREKLHGMFPRQYPERWLDRTAPVRNDNRPYNDSAIWVVDALLRYLRETGDVSILSEVVPTVRLTDPDKPETSALVGHGERLPVWEVLLEIFACYQRQALDSPYGMIQAMFGDWADPVDMFGTSRVGDNTTRGDGRGVLVRLSCHVFGTLAATINLFKSLMENPPARSRGRQSAHFDKSAIGHRPSAIDVPRLERELPALQKFAVDLRAAILRLAWEPEGQFVDAIHELKADGTAPDYARGETGYTLGSRRPEREFDGTPRTVLTPCAWGLALLQTTASWLPPLPKRDEMIRALLANVDRHCFSQTNGLNLYVPPVANTERACRLVGRLGMLPPGCAENGEYHHAQVMMHFFRSGVPGQADTAWAQFKPVLSSARGPELCGPFDQTSNSYACDPDDPHCGAGMNFGLSGSMDWMFELLESFAGLKLALHDPTQPDLRIEPNLPASFRGQYSLRRILHKADGHGGFIAVPLNLTIAPVAAGEAVGVTLNGQPVARAEVADIAAHQRLDFYIRVAAS
jgi:hypothetical protein